MASAKPKQKMTNPPLDSIEKELRKEAGFLEEEAVLIEKTGEKKLKKLVKILKKKETLGFTSIFLAFAVATYSFFNFNLAIERTPLLKKILREKDPEALAAIQEAKLQTAVLPQNGIIIPVKWGNFGTKLIEAGIIDKQKFEQIYATRGGLSEGDKKLLYGTDNDNIQLTLANSNLVLNLLWALGLGSKSEVLEKGPMIDKQYGGAGKFASTGGWTLARGNAMDHYSMHRFFNLTPEQEDLVKRVTQGIYRPCCGNSTYFPDCNHGMAMLGLMELMASQGATEAQMYKTALGVNSFWFPDTYLNIAKYFDNQGTPWNKVDPKEILGANYSSGAGYRQILNKITPTQKKSGGGCGI